MRPTSFHLMTLQIVHYMQVCNHKQTVSWPQSQFNERKHGNKHVDKSPTMHATHLLVAS
jgi:hypothetical protein